MRAFGTCAVRPVVWKCACDERHDIAVMRVNRCGRRLQCAKRSSAALNESETRGDRGMEALSCRTWRTEARTADVVSRQPIEVMNERCDDSACSMGDLERPDGPLRLLSRRAKVALGRPQSIPAAEMAKRTPLIAPIISRFRFLVDGKYLLGSGAQLSD